MSLRAPGTAVGAPDLESQAEAQTPNSEVWPFAVATGPASPRFWAHFGYAVPWKLGAGMCASQSL